MSKRFDPVHPWHHHIEQNQISFVFVDKPQCFRTAPYHAGVVTRATKQARQNLGISYKIINN